MQWGKKNKLRYRPLRGPGILDVGLGIPVGLGSPLALGWSGFEDGRMCVAVYKKT